MDKTPQKKQKRELPNQTSETSDMESKQNWISHRRELAKNLAKKA
jgi:hypothetical protein